VRRFRASKTQIFVHLGRERLRNGWEMAGETAELRPRSRPALLLEVINVGSRIAIGPGIEEVEPCLCEGAPRAVFPDAVP
jgi:hypothetical protein